MREIAQSYTRHRFRINTDFYLFRIFIGGLEGFKG